MGYLTSFSDWMRFIHIIDPSNHGSQGLKINCFTKKYKEWLPHPEWQHVLILRNVKVTSIRQSFSLPSCLFFLRWYASRMPLQELDTATSSVGLHSPLLKTQSTTDNLRACPEKKVLRTAVLVLTFHPFINQRKVRCYTA